MLKEAIEGVTAELRSLRFASKLLRSRTEPEQPAKAQGEHQTEWLHQQAAAGLSAWP